MNSKAFVTNKDFDFSNKDFDFFDLINHLNNFDVDNCCKNFYLNVQIFWHPNNKYPWNMSAWCFLSI